MSRTEARALAGIFAAALVLRLGVAVLTETYPLFPSYYYTDAQRLELLVTETMAAERAGRPSTAIATQSQLIQVKTQVALYRLFGPRPLAIKVLNSLLGALACAVLGAALLPAFGLAPALASAALYAAWPTNVFYTSQNFKDSPTNLLAYLSLWGFLILLAGKPRRAVLTAAIAGGVLLTLTVGALYRAYILPVLVAAMVLACALEIARRKKVSTASALYLAMALVALSLYAPASRWFTAGQPQGRGLATQVIPLSWDGKSRPTSPRGLTEFRRSQLEIDRDWARANRGREISTQLFPDARFETYWDVVVFLPKGMFYALFMPLPGLYPMEGKIGRLMAGLENLLLLALAGFGFWRILRGPKTPERAFLVLFFAGMTVGAGLLQPDLGSATRHKLLYLPLLFPFAVEQMLRFAPFSGLSRRFSSR